MTIDRSAAMRGLWDQAIDIADTLDDIDWTRPVPWCPAWSVGDLVSHLGGLQSMLNGDPQPAAPDGDVADHGGSPFDAAMAPLVAARRQWTPEQRIDEVRHAGDVFVARLASTSDWLEKTDGPVGPTTMDGLFRVRCFDLWVHLQDLREALGRPLDLDDTSPGADAAHQYVLGLVPWMFAKRVGATEGAALRMTLSAPLDHDSVLEVVERRATWNPVGDDGGAVVEGKPGALTLLCAGRATPSRWRDAGALHWHGAWGEQFVAAARLF